MQSATCMCVHDSQTMDSLGIEPRASRMLSGCDTTTPTAPEQKVQIWIKITGWFYTNSKLEIRCGSTALPQCWSLGTAHLRQSARPPARANNTASWSKRPSTDSVQERTVLAAQPPWASHTSGGRYWTQPQGKVPRYGCVSVCGEHLWRHAVPAACRVSSQWLSPRGITMAMCSAIGEVLCGWLPSEKIKQVSCRGLRAADLRRPSEPTSSQGPCSPTLEWGRLLDRSQEEAWSSCSSFAWQVRRVNTSDFWGLTCTCPAGHIWAPMLDKVQEKIFCP